MLRLVLNTLIVWYLGVSLCKQSLVLRATTTSDGSAYNEAVFHVSNTEVWLASWWPPAPQRHPYLLTAGVCYGIE